MLHFNCFRNKSFAIDLGNTNTLVSDENRLLLSQPSYIAFDTTSHAVKAIGDQAFNMFEKNHQDLTPVKPLKGGVIADYESAAQMIRGLLNRADQKKSIFSGYDHLISGVPYHTTEVERRALRDALGQFGARKTSLLYEPLAAALGIGLDIREPEGKMIIDIGGGITEIVIISLSGIAAFQSTKVAGDTFDEEIQDYFRRQYNMAIGIRTAEQVKIAVGAVMEDITDVPPSMLVRGKDMIEGIPVTRRVDHREVAFILEKSICAIELSIIQTLETCPPELASDIFSNGIHLTGGNALLRGLCERFGQRLRLPVHVDSDALVSVSRGISATLRDTKKFNSVLMD